MKLPAPERRESGDDNLIPLINIVFLLLIFFMLAGALTRPDPLNVEPPQAASGEAANVNEAVLSVAADGRLALDGETVPREQLGERVARLAANGEAPMLKLKADAELSAELLLPLLDELRDAGIDRLRLLTVPSGS